MNTKPPTNAILHGDALTILRSLPDSSVHGVITSPPYFNLRNYSVPPTVWGGVSTCKHQWVVKRYYHEGGNSTSSKLSFSEAGPENAKRIKDTRWHEDSACSRCGAWLGCLGNEYMPSSYIDHLVQVMHEVHRVLRPEGQLWVNLGDSYAGGGYAGGLPQKSLMQIPARFAIAMQDAGWILRNDIIWAKDNVKPESVTDRCTVDYEHVFFFTKQPRYYFDHEAIKVPTKYGANGSSFTGGKAGHHANQGKSTYEYEPTRNLRAVWHCTAEAFSGSHYAVMPTKLVEPCIQAMPLHVCEHCATPWQRLTTKVRRYVGNSALAGRTPEDINDSGKWAGQQEGNVNLKSGPVTITMTTGWQQKCRCADSTGTGRAIVLDPFMGRGTVGLVAKAYGRDYLGIDLSEENVALAERYISTGGRYDTEHQGTNMPTLFEGGIA
jgi:DNA modification methylase